MNDRELIELVERTAPDELSDEQIGLLRRRLPGSPALQDALHGQLRLDQALNDALGGFEIGVDAVLAAAAAVPPYWLRPFGGRLGWWGLGGLIVVVLGSLATLPLVRDAFVRRAAPQAAVAAPNAAPARADEPPRAALAEAPPMDAALDVVEPAAAATPQATERAAARPNLASAAAVLPPHDGPLADEDGPLDDESSPSDAAGGLRIEVEAERFARGNVEIDTTVFGEGIGVVRCSGGDASFVEFDIPVAEPGDYELEVRYAADEVRPFRAVVHGQVVEFDAPSTGNCYPEAQHWFTLGTFALPAGKTAIRVEADGPLPHLDKLALVTAGPRVAVAAPWTDALGRTARQIPFEQACFQDFDPARGGPAPGELEQWLAALPGESHAITYRDGLAPLVDGLLRLEAPWPDDGALRLALYDHRGFQIHFWFGRGGVTLRYHHGPRPVWAAYRTTRVSAGPRPTEFALVATDDDRYRRTGQGTIEVRQHAGALVVTRGDVRLLTAPLDGPPAEVYFEGRAALRGIALYRSSPPPPDDVVRPVVLRSLKPASMSWHSRLPEGAALTRRDDGSISLTFDPSARIPANAAAAESLVSAKAAAGESAWAALPIGPAGLCEVLLEVEDPQPGGGVFLGDGAGRMSHRLGFFRDAATGRTCFGLLPPGEMRTEVQHDAANAPAPYAGERQWLRLVVGCGTLRCWTSGDGLHWSQAAAPLAREEGMAGYTHVGLYCLPGDHRGIALRSIEVRELSAVTSLAGLPLRAAAAALIQESVVREPGLDRGAWLQGVLERQPPGVDADEWRRACAIQTLAAGPPRALANELLLCLVEEGLAAETPLAARLALLDEAAQLADTGVEGTSVERAARLLRQFDALEDRLPAADRLLGFAAIARSALCSPLLCDAGTEVLPLAAARREILTSFFVGDTTGLEQLARQLRHWSRAADPTLPASAERSAIAALAASAQAEHATGGGEPSLAAATDEEAQRFVEQMRQSSSAGDYRAACQALVASGADARALFPDPADSRRIVSAAAAVGDLFRIHPDLARTMADEHAAASIESVKQALAAQDATAVETAAWRYAGTPAAALAHVWLGDRALSAGRFATAQRAYRGAERWASESLLPDIRARLRLIAAIDGRQQGMPPMGAVVFGGRELTAEEFEKVVAELVALRRTAERVGAAAGPATGGAAPRPAQYAAHAAFPLPEGGTPGRSPRRLASLVAGQRLYVADGSSVAAFDLAAESLVWSAAPAETQLPSPTADTAVASGEMPLAPLLIGDKLLVRWTIGTHGRMACLDAADGRLRWASPPEVFVLGGPLLLEDRLCAVTLSPAGDGGGPLEVSFFDLDQGAVVVQRPLVRLPAGAPLPPCRAVVAGDRLLATCGECLACCDATGRLLWLRRQEVFPATGAADGAPPLVDDGAVYVARPGLHGVECLDLESGALRWRQPLPDAEQIVGLGEGRLVVALPGALAAFDSATGNPLWTHRDAALLSAHGVVEGHACYARREALSGAAVTGRLIWLGLSDGAPHHSAALAGVPLDDLGSFVPHGEDRLTWAAAADGSRTLVRLSPRDAALPAVGGGPLDAWTTHADPAWRHAVAAALPDWVLLASGGGGLAAAADRQAVLNTGAASPARPARLARRLNVPAGYRVRLLVEVGREGSGSWRLVVALAGQTLLERAIDAASAPDGWATIEIDLSAESGSDGWLTVTQQAIDGAAVARWKRLEIVASPR